jgi:hypothetical protein
MRTQIIAVFLAWATLNIFPAPAAAQAPVDTQGWIVSPAVGLALDPDADPSLTLAAGLAYAFPAALAVEGELGHVFDTHDVVRPPASIDATEVGAIALRLD